MPENNSSPYPNPTDPVEIDLFADGHLRPLRYSIASIKRLKKTLGRSLLGRNGGLLDIDEEMLPELILEGLRGPKGENPDVTVEQIEALPSTAYIYLVKKFSEAFLASFPEKKMTEMAAPAGKPN